MAKIEENMRAKRRITKVQVQVRLTREQILKIEHYAIWNDIDVSEAHRQLLERGFNSTAGGPAVPPNVSERLFFKHRVKWVDPDGKLELNKEPDDDTLAERAARQERELEEQLAAREAELIFKAFGEPREPSHCIHCGATNELKFTWYAADKPPWGNCQGCGEPSYVSDYLARFHPENEGTDDVQ